MTCAVRFMPFKCRPDALKALEAGETVSAIAARIAQSGAQLQSLLDDLVDFNRTNFGLDLHIAPSKVELAQLYGDSLAQLRTAHPDRRN